MNIVVYIIIYKSILLTKGISYSPTHAEQCNIWVMLISSLVYVN